MKKKELRKQNSITSAFDNARLLKAIIERLASKHIEYTYRETLLPAGLKSMDTSTVEVYVSGKSLIAGRYNSITTSFETCFLFTCIRSSDSEYEMTWACSLS